MKLAAILAIIAICVLRPAGKGVAFDTYAQPSQRDCSAYPTAPRFESVSSCQTKYRTIAQKLLDDEKAVIDVTPTMYKILDDVIDDAKARLSPTPQNLNDEQYGTFVDRSFRTIDCVLARHGFVYPSYGLVQLLADGLDPTIFAQDSFKGQKTTDPVFNDFAILLGAWHNQGRETAIKDRKPGPYYVVDCDIASFIYLGIAEVMHYPVFLVEISNHNFVRWQRDKKTWYDFETMDGFIPPDGDSYYVSGHGFHVDERERVEDGYLSNMSPTRIIEYHDRLIARAASWKHDYATMIRFYELAFITDPRRGEAANDVAWFYAAFPDPNLRDGRKAVEYAKKAVALDPSVDNLDTLACAYAQATDMNDARATEAKIAALNTRPSNPSIATDAGVIAGGGTCKDPTLIDSDPLPFRPNAQKQTRMPTTRELKNLH